MNRKIIYVDFIFKRKRITSKFLLFIYMLKFNISFLFKNFTIFSKINKYKLTKNNKSYSSNKVSSK